MRGLRLSDFASRITVISIAIAVGATAIVYVYAVAVGGAASGDHPVKLQILLGGLIAVAVAAAVGIYYTRTAADNIERLQEAARKVADGNFETTIPVASVGQLGQLARTFNEMQRRLAELDSARKRFIANASHELRTPIFSLGGFVELLEDEDPSPEERAEFVRTMRQQIDRLTKLATDLLDLSQLDAGAVEMRASTVDLTALAREVTREFGARANSADRGCSCALPNGRRSPSGTPIGCGRSSVSCLTTPSPTRPRGPTSP